MSADQKISVPRTVLAIAISLVFVVPFLFLIATALRTPSDFAANPGGLPRAFALDNLKAAWVDADLGRALIVTFVVACLACVVCVSVSIAAAFWFRLNTGRASRILRYLLIAGYTIPTIAWLLPVFVLLARSQLTGNIFVAGLLNGVASVPFAIYLFYTWFLQVLTQDILDAAALEGVSVVKRFRHIAVPMARPAIATVVALVFVWTFGELLIAATILQSAPDSYTLPLAAISLATRESVNLQGQAAAALVSLVPVLFIFALAQKSLASGFGGTDGK